MSRVPRLLVVAQFGPHAPGGGGALTRQLLRGYPADKIAWWSPDHLTSPDSGFAVSEHAVFSIPSKAYPQRKLVRLKSWLLERLWAPLAARHLQSTVARLRPDQVWIYLYEWVIPVAWRSGLVDHQRCHVSLWDYPDTLARQRMWGKSRTARFVHQVERLYSRAQSCDVVCEPMLQDMTARTARKQDVFLLHSGIEPGQMARLTSGQCTEPAGLRVAYAGTIVVPESFTLLVEALRQARAVLTQPISLEFFGNHSYRTAPWFDPQWMQEHGQVREEAFMAALENCAWGAIAMNLEENDPQYSRFSFPNKFGTYLAAGLPILGLAHRGSSLDGILDQYQVGVCLHDKDPAILAAKLVSLFNKPQTKPQYLPELQRCAQSEFNADAMRHKLWTAFGVEA